MLHGVRAAAERLRLGVTCSAAATRKRSTASDHLRQPVHRAQVLGQRLLRLSATSAQPERTEAESWGEIHLPETLLIPSAFEAINGERGELEIFSTD